MQDDVIKFEAETIKSSLRDYSDAFILVTGNIAVNADNNTDAALLRTIFYMYNKI